MIARNSKVVSIKDYVAGWLDSSIHDFLGDFPSTSESLKYALITCIDSNVDPISMLNKSPELKSVSKIVQIIGRGLLLPTSQLVAASAHSRIFFGFDEIWFFPSDRIEPKPNSDWLVGPGRIEQRTLEDLSAWMTENSCSLALGDGEGLNFIVKARGLVKVLLGHSIAQPDANAVFVPSPTDDAAG